MGEVTAITVLVHRIREKNGLDLAKPHYTQTVCHVGYRFGDSGNVEVDSRTNALENQASQSFSAIVA